MPRFLGLALLVAAGLLAPLFIYPVFLMKALCFAIFACAFNLLFGFGGLLSFGHSAFFGGAAYITGYVVKIWGFTPELGLLTGIAAGAALGLVFAVLATRRQGIYFAMITFGLAQMVYFVALQLPFTGGEDGLQTVPRRALFGVIDLSSNLSMYYFVLIVFLSVLAAIWRIVHSPFGQVLHAIRDNEQRAISLGYRVHHYKILVFVLSAAFAGLAGGLKCLVFGIATLTDVYWHTSGEVVLMTILGGVGTMLGPVVGAALVVGIQNYFAELGAWVTMIQGAIFVIVVMAFRRGIVGELIPLLYAHLGETGQRAKSHIALATATADPVDGDRRSSGDSPLPVVAVGSPCKTTDGAA
jgi:branched-chain amino acid transport system permease protein